MQHLPNVVYCLYTTDDIIAHMLYDIIILDNDFLWIHVYNICTCICVQKFSNSPQKGQCSIFVESFIIDYFP